MQQLAQVFTPLSLLELPVQSRQCELMGIVFGEMRLGNILWRLLVKLVLRHQVYFLMFRPGIEKCFD